MQTNFAEMVGTADAVLAGHFLDTDTSHALNQECRELTPELGLSPDTTKEASAGPVSVAWGCVTQDASAGAMTDAWSCMSATAGPMSLGFPICMAESASAGPMTIDPGMCLTEATAAASPASMTPWNCIAGNA